MKVFIVCGSYGRAKNGDQFENLISWFGSTVDNPTMACLVVVTIGNGNF